MAAHRRLIRIEEVLAITGISKSVIYEMIKRGEFPRQRRIGQRSVGWHQSDIDDWLDSLPPATEENWK